ncbi:putative Histidine phosphatase superfamily (branch 1) [Trypanosoma vivax]|uniref:Uncharacterized protein n=1 Tax=Trypanosoma vivax (strain Y486) TaxID=1055687 RepID=G0UAY0_TRYVY|nr:hypothetical protein TRVL_02187 [Trypanosoma vivax]KAH8611617.1 putative Histidine phosphatase superfamily (branch 1) [Trypanosoma vivax]CCC52967.1 conserved hypothetical protein [Trypanosoma vivax Y486]
MTAVQYAQAAKRRSVQRPPLSDYFRDELLLLRHGERLDHVDRAWKLTSNGTFLHLPDADPPLSAVGRRQALETGIMFLRQRQHRKIRQRALGMLSMLLVSPFHRCVETALIVNIVGFNGELAMFFDPLLSDWHSPRIYTRPPRLGGTYHVDGINVGFHPHWEALAPALTSFFRCVAASVGSAGMMPLSVTEAMSARWLAISEELCSQAPCFPVWTSSSMTKSLCLNSGANFDCLKSVPRSPWDGVGKVTALKGNTGIDYPESANALLRRVGEAVRVHFAANSMERSSVPRLVEDAIQQEVKQLPSAFFRKPISTESTVATAWSSGLGPPYTVSAANAMQTKNRPEGERYALLPSMRVMMVTHADVVSMALKHCCPTHYITRSGFSVPYCSITSIFRSNDFYIRPEASAKGPKRCVDSEPPWRVEAVGSTSHMQTTIVLEYD